jgi:hypothetical protein
LLVTDAAADAADSCVPEAVVVTFAAFKVAAEEDTSVGFSVNFGSSD